MSYNSQVEKLEIAEYGRNVQNLILYAKSIAEDEKRQQVIEQIVDLMQQMHPYNKNIAEYREKLWKHVFRIAQYDLNVKPPSGEIPDAEDGKTVPEKLEYPTFESRYRHYGHNVQTLVKKAAQMENGPKKEEFIRIIGSYMKLAYRTWNRDHYVSDEIIKGDLEKLAKGMLQIDEGMALDFLTSVPRKRPKQSQKSSGRRDYKKNNRSRKRRN
jgi:hypothetical protein